ncbi:MAG TPA: YqiA/YcfP family alpha/beta fold hydrolase [Thermoanaerobaculia bacterium]
MIAVLYFHGFASSPASAKITALRPLLGDAIELITPDLNVPSFEQLDYDAMIALALDAARRTPPRAIVGSSLGAIVALEVASRGVDAPLVLIAPALGVADRWKERLPAGDPIVVFNHARARNVPIHRRFFEQIAQVRVDADPPRCRVTVLMGRKDETVPFDCVERVWKSWSDSGRLPAGSRFLELEEGDHSLVNHTSLIADAIREAAASD